MNELSFSDVEYFKDTLAELLKGADKDTQNDMQNICDELVRGYNEKRTD